MTTVSLPPAGRARSGVRAGPALAAAGFAALVLLAAFPGALAPYAPDAVDPLHALSAPGGGHWLGSDQLGRDVFSRIVYGARPSLVIGVGATAVGVTAGTVLGLLAALSGPRVDAVLMRITDVLLAFPPLLLALLIVALSGPGIRNATLAVAVAVVPAYARILRAQALVVRRADYVQVATGLAIPWPRVVARHVLPNSVGPVLVLATIGLGESILAGAALSFLGLGPRPPSPEWGTMLSDGRDYLDQAWWIAVFPGLAVTAAVTALTALGRRLQTRVRDGAPR
ncbi:ABC transporter permease [Catenulispora yoronensis]|uniref:ABC transporter permease n=1 Tax=Catenulispora yoronensis TaxID=450799 RepID=A0ABN2UZD3_9ACTN